MALKVNIPPRLLVFALVIPNPMNFALFTYLGSEVVFCSFFIL
jgi:hypothetical protein